MYNIHMYVSTHVFLDVARIYKDMEIDRLVYEHTRYKRTSFMCLFAGTHHNNVYDNIYEFM